MPFLRQSTVQTIRFGPFLDIADGVTEEVGLTITQALRRISKDGAAFAQSNHTGNSVHDSDGWYSDDLDATDTNTVGELILNVQVPATHLPVWMRWWVLEEAVYDSIFGAAAAGPLQSTVAARKLDVTAAGEAGIDLDNTVGTIAAAQIAAGALNGKGDWNIGKTGYSLSVAGILAIWHQLTSAVVTAGTIGLQIKTNLDAVLTARTLAAASYFDPATDTVANVTTVATTIFNNDMRGTDGANTVTPPTVAAIADAVWDELLAGHTIADSAGLLLNEWQDGGRLDLLLDDVPTTAEFNARTLVAASYFDPATNTITLPGQVAPPLAPTYQEAMGWVHKIIRNRKRQTATLWELLADDELTVDAKATLSDDGTTAIKQEIVSGP